LPAVDRETKKDFYSPIPRRFFMGISVNISVNGRAVAADVDPRTLLVDFIRTNCRLTGTHVGCDTAQCGACTVHVNGRAVKSCNMLAAQVNGATVLTIEGVAAANGEMNPLQAAFKECHGLQCGFCTPGMVMSALELAGKVKNPSDEEIRAALDGNMCRCTGYHNIVKAVKTGLEAMK
jgi:carbon-monoxide dehydrogenase small subunit